MRGEFIEVEERQHYYYAAITGCACEPILLIHGFPTTSHLCIVLVFLLPGGHLLVVL